MTWLAWAALGVTGLAIIVLAAVGLVVVLLFFTVDRARRRQGDW